MLRDGTPRALCHRDNESGESFAVSKCRPQPRCRFKFLSSKNLNSICSTRTVLFGRDPDAGMRQHEFRSCPPSQCDGGHPARERELILRPDTAISGNGNGNREHECLLGSRWRRWGQRDRGNNFSDRSLHGAGRSASYRERNRDSLQHC
jgi:hypothetical protein